MYIGDIIFSLFILRHHYNSMPPLFFFVIFLGNTDCRNWTRIDVLNELLFVTQMCSHFDTYRVLVFSSLAYLLTEVSGAPLFFSWCTCKMETTKTYESLDEANSGFCHSCLHGS